MKTMRAVAAVLTLALGLPLLADQREVQQLVDDGKYSEAVSQVDKLLRDKNTSVPDQYNLLMLKGEAALRAGQRSLAVSAFNAAGRIAADRKEAVAAAANALVAQRAVQGIVKVGAQNYPAISPEQRKLAMQKMADEIMTGQARELEAALSSRTLNPIIEVAPAVLHMYVLEMQATDGDSRNAEPVVKRLSEQTQQLIADELQRLQRDIDINERNAYEIDNWQGWTVRGLTTFQRRDLQDMVPYIDRIHKTVLSARRIAWTFRGDIAAWDRLAADCEDLQQQIQTVLSSNY